MRPVRGRIAGRAVNLVVEEVTWAEAEAPLSAIRKTVFMDEQRVPPELEWDGEDEAARHLLASLDGEPVGCARMLKNGHIGRMAVLRPHRRTGVGGTLLSRLLAMARDAGLQQVILNAQVSAVPFYESHGFTAHGDVFMDAGIPHRCMKKSLEGMVP